MNTLSSSSALSGFHLENLEISAFSLPESQLVTGFENALRSAAQGHQVILRFWQRVGRRGLDAVLQDPKFRLHDGLAWFDGRTGSGFVTRGALLQHCAL